MSNKGGRIFVGWGLRKKIYNLPFLNGTLIWFVLFWGGGGGKRKQSKLSILWEGRNWIYVAREGEGSGRASEEERGMRREKKKETQKPKARTKHSYAGYLEA